MADVEYGEIKEGRQSQNVEAVVGMKYMQIGSSISAAGLLLYIAINGGGTMPDGRPNSEFLDYATPATWAFAIWGLIYTLVFGFIVYQALPKYEGRNDDLIFN